MPGFVFVLFFKTVLEAVRVFRKKVQEARGEPLCAGCFHAHVQYGANARRAISCTYGGPVRPMKLDVLYCTDYQARNLPARSRVIGFVCEISPAE
ncbi:MAG TPA: hypothetical protein VGK96_26385 [Candidatus Sulfotelmatobacter sp.]|jgi:hypothetical protein